MARPSRHLARVIALQTLFAYECHGGSVEELVTYVSEEFQKNAADMPLAFDIVKGVVSKREEIRTRIATFAPEWPVEKISPIDRVILEISVFEIAFANEVPPIVAIDEAIELAKTFGSENSPKFVNGVLNAILNARPIEGKAPPA